MVNIISCIPDNTFAGVKAKQDITKLTKFTPEMHHLGTSDTSHMWLFK